MNITGVQRKLGFIKKELKIKESNGEMLIAIATRYKSLSQALLLLMSTYRHKNNK